MKIDEIKELLSAFDASAATSFSLEADGFRLDLKKDACIAAPVIAPAAAIPVSVAAVSPAAPAAEAAPAQKPDGLIVKSPIVGVAYRGPEPDAEPFVTKGQAVKKGQKLCLVEAMKMFNEITAPADGIITSILFEDGKLVEFDAPLFEIGNTSC